MSSRLYIRDNQELPASDLMAMQDMRRDQIDNLVIDAVDNTMKFAGFGITQSGSSAMIVGAGRLYIAGLDYSRPADSGVSFDLISGTVSLPVAQQKIISLVGWGTEQESGVLPREFETAVTDSSGAYTGEYTVESRSVSTEKVRFANLALLEGLESANPQPPAVGNTQVEIARIRCSSLGIVSITFVESNRLESIKDLDTRARELENFRDASGAAISSIISDIASLRASLSGLPPKYLIDMLTADMARVKEQLGRDDSAVAYGSITFGSSNEMDLSHAQSLCRIDGTLTFPDAAVKEQLFSFANPNEPLVVKRGALTLPVYTEVLEIDTTLGLSF